MKRIQQIVCGLSWVLSLFLVGTIFAKEVDKTVPAAVRTEDGQRVRGNVSAYDESGFTLIDRDGNSHEFTWNDLPTTGDFALHRKLVPTNDAQAWFDLGVRLRQRDRGERASDAAFALALKADPKLKPKVKKAKTGGESDKEQGKGGGKNTQKQADGKGTDAKAKGAEDAKDTKKAAKKKGNGAKDGDGGAGKHRRRRLPQSALWGDLSDDLNAQSVKALKKFAKHTQEKMHHRLAPHETEHFLFYSDLPASESAFWAKQLEDMYDRLQKIFDLPETRNVFRGKALIFVFKDPNDYDRYERMMENSKAGKTIGKCHSYGNGYVHVAFYRASNKWHFAEVLVHETTHAFEHRYKSPKFIVSWVNEGLATYVSDVLVPKTNIPEIRKRRALKKLNKSASLGGMFEKKHIAAWQYGVALLLTDFMISQDSERYAAFINGIKDGLDWRESMKKRYTISTEKLLKAFAHKYDLPPLTQ